MPELPEVETVACYIAKHIVGKVFSSAHTPAHYSRALHKTSGIQLSKLLYGQKVKKVYRRAKFIVLELDSGALAIHLRMTGRLLIDKPKKDQYKYVTAWFKFKNNNYLYFQDTRKFGRIYFYKNVKTLDEKLGVEPLSAIFNANLCYHLLTNRKRQLKPLLLDQKVIAGIGNIYADEILWATKLHPQSLSSSLSLKKCAEICKHTKRILKKSIELNGTTFQSFYFGNELSGEFADNLKVFDRTGRPCKRCKTPIEKLKVGQRGTHICPKCQQLV